MRRKKRERKRGLDTETHDQPKWMPSWVKKHEMLFGILFILILMTLIIGPLTWFAESKKEFYQESVATNPNRKFGNQNKTSASNNEYITIEQFKGYVVKGKITEFTKQKDETTDSYILKGKISGIINFKIDPPPSINQYNTEIEKFLSAYPDVSIKPTKVIALRRGGGFNFFWIILIGFSIYLIVKFIRNGGFKKKMDPQLAQAQKHNKAKVEIFEPGEVNVSFDDVAGCEEAKEELEEVVDFLKNPLKYTYLGGKIPKGVLLVGPPGCGKTLLAKAVAGESNVAFFYLTGSDFDEMFVGTGAARVRDLFEQAEKKAPCIIFIDELDSAGKARSNALSGTGQGQTLNKLLGEMDGFRDRNLDIITIGATNRPDQLDTALIRPGRFDRQVVVDRPDIKGREAILKIHARDVRINEKKKEKYLKILAQRTAGLSGADLANIINEAALLAARHNKKEVGFEELDEGITRALAGMEQKSKQMSEEEKKIIAHHEAGHTIVGYCLQKDKFIVQKISIVRTSRGALGYTVITPSGDKYITTKQELKDQIAVLLGGRAVEDIELDIISTTAANDLERATGLARKYVCRFGMSSEIGAVSYGESKENYIGQDWAFPKEYSEKTANIIDDEIKKLIDDCYKKTCEKINENMPKIKILVKKLLEKEVIEKEEIEEILER